MLVSFAESGVGLSFLLYSIAHSFLRKWTFLEQADAHRKHRSCDLRVTMIGLGIIGLLHCNFVPVWNPAPKVSAGGLLVSLSSLISLSAGIGLLIRRMAGAAARLLLATFLLSLLLFRLPNFLRVPAFAACWSVFPLAVMLAATWVLYVWFATDWDRNYLSFLIGSNGLRIARTLYGLSLIFFGAAHFIDLKKYSLAHP